MILTIGGGDDYLRIRDHPDKKEVTNIVFAEPDKVELCEDASMLFAGYTNLEEIIGINELDTSNVVDMHGMFLWCESLESLNVSAWDTGQVTTMSHMFEDCYSLNSLDIANWDTGQVTTMEGMFRWCKALKSLDISNWDVSNVTDMAEMFIRCRNLKSLDIANWDVSNVVNAEYIFAYCSNLCDLQIPYFGNAKRKQYALTETPFKFYTLNRLYKKQQKSGLANTLSSQVGNTVEELSIDRDKDLFSELFSVR